MPRVVGQFVVQVQRNVFLNPIAIHNNLSLRSRALSHLPGAPF
jgi:hypothetical protein